MAKGSGTTRSSSSSNPRGLMSSISASAVDKAKFEYTGSGYYKMRGEGFNGNIIATQGYEYGSTIYESYASVKGEMEFIGNYNSLSKAKKSVKDYIKGQIKG